MFIKIKRQKVYIVKIVSAFLKRKWFFGGMVVKRIYAGINTLYELL